MNRKLQTFAFSALVMAGGLMLAACTPNPAGLRKRPFFLYKRVLICLIFIQAVPIKQFQLFLVFQPTLK